MLIFDSLFINEITTKIYSIDDNNSQFDMNNNTKRGMEEIGNTNEFILFNDFKYMILQIQKLNENKMIQMFLGFIVTGITAGISLYLANVWLDKKREPKLMIDKKKSPIVVEIDLNLIDESDPCLPYLTKHYFTYLPDKLKNLKVRYSVNRIVVRNKHERNAAVNCKGILKINEVEEKVSWYIPSETSKITINAQSLEYLDLCALIKSSEKDRIKKELNSVFVSAWYDIVTYETLKQDTKNKIIEELNNWIETNEILPSIISPTENGWKSPPHINRKTENCNASIIITSGNTRPIKTDVKILESDSHGKIIEFI